MENEINSDNNEYNTLSEEQIYFVVSVLKNGEHYFLKRTKDSKYEIGLCNRKYLCFDFAGTGADLEIDHCIYSIITKPIDVADFKY